MKVWHQTCTDNRNFRQIKNDWFSKFDSNIQFKWVALLKRLFVTEVEYLRPRLLRQEEL